MATENVALMQSAKESLRGKWGLAIGGFLLYLVVSVFLQLIPFAGALAPLIISGPFSLGMAFFTLSISRNTQPKIEQLFQGFEHFGTAFLAYLISTVIVLLFTLLLIIPGIIVGISYSMTFYIIADNPSIGAMEAIKQSKKMMDGYKLKFFYLGLRFFGLGLLCILTLGIGFFWLIPYMQVTFSKFYDDLKGQQVNSSENF
jgi:uncharacterized membrane protein